MENITARPQETGGVANPHSVAMDGGGRRRGGELDQRASAPLRISLRVAARAAVDATLRLWRSPPRHASRHPRALAIDGAALAYSTTRSTLPVRLEMLEGRGEEGKGEVHGSTDDGKQRSAPPVSRAPHAPGGATASACVTE